MLFLKVVLGFLARTSNRIVIMTRKLFWTVVFTRTAARGRRVPECTETMKSTLIRAANTVVLMQFKMQVNIMAIGLGLLRVTARHSIERMSIKFTTVMFC